jgi:hypothetical protein
MPVNVQQALDLRLNKNLSYAQIGQIQGVSDVAIFNKIKPLLPDQCNEVYKAQRSDILSHTQLKILSSISSQDLKKANLQAKAVSFGIFYDKERLERGLATERIDHLHLSASLDDLQAERDRLLALRSGKNGGIQPSINRDSPTIDGRPSLDNGCQNRDIPK